MTKYHRLGDLNNRCLFLAVLELGCPRSRCRQIQVLLGSLFLLQRAATLQCAHVTSLCAGAQRNKGWWSLFLLLEGADAFIVKTLMASCKCNYFPNTPHIGGQGFNVKILGDTHLLSTTPPHSHSFSPQTLMSMLQHSSSLNKAVGPFLKRLVGFWFGLVFGCTRGTSKFPGQGSNLCHCSDQGCCSGNAGSLFHCASNELWLVFS